MAEPDTDPGQEVAVEVDFTGNGLTLNEIIVVETLSGERVHDRSGTFMRAVAWVTGRRVNPHLSIEEAGELVVRSGG